MAEIPLGDQNPLALALKLAEETTALRKENARLREALTGALAEYDRAMERAEKGSLAAAINARLPQAELFIARARAALGDQTEEAEGGG